MTRFASDSGLRNAARITFSASMLLFVVTIVIGILNGIDVWEPNHDSLIGHVHAGTLGWITLGVTGIGFLMFSKGREVSADEAKQAGTLAWAMVASVTLYAGAFFLGDVVFSDRIQRPIVGTLLFAVVIWYFAWLLKAHRSYGGAAPYRLGFVLSWISLMIGAVLGVMLGLYTSNGSVPGLADDVAARFAEAHPPAMVIGYLLLAGFAIVEWLLHADNPASRQATVIMWLLFAAGAIVNIAFITGKDEELVGPANLLMIVAVVMMLWRTRSQLAPSGWKGAGAGAFPRIALLMLVGYMVLLTILVSWIVGGTIDFDAMSESQLGLILAFDHAMFIGVMTNALFGVLARELDSEKKQLANTVLLWGVNIGIIGFAAGLITTTQVLKHIFTPLMGLALLHGLSIYFMELRRSDA
jgi:hypothetical protein